jgi:adenosylhomocysteine nucleosidase
MGKEPWGQWTLYRGEMWDMPYAVVRCGPGKVAMAAATQAVVQYLEPKLLMSFGAAGSCDPRVRVGSLCVGRVVMDVALAGLSDLPVSVRWEFTANARLTTALCAVPGTVPMTVLSWEGHVASPAHRPEIPDPPDHFVVDWGGAAVAQVAEMWEVPWGVLKVVSDHGEADRLRMLAMIAKRPLQWGAEVIRRACHACLSEGTTGQQLSAQEEARG